MLMRALRVNQNSIVTTKTMSLKTINALWIQGELRRWMKILRGFDISSDPFYIAHITY